MKITFPGQAKTQDIIVNALVIFAIVLILLPLKEVTLGHKLKWIAIHVALTQAVLFLLAFNSFAALLSFFKFKNYLLNYLKVSVPLAVAGWTVNYLLMLWVTRITWGGFDWQEPRMELSTQLLFLLLPYLGLNLLIGYTWLLKYTTLMLGIFAQFLIRFAPVINHPADPVGTSDDASLGVFFVSLIFLFIVLIFYDSWLLARLRFLKTKESLLDR